MKKLLLLLTITLSISSYSQFKVKAGTNTSLISGTMAIKFNNKVESKYNYNEYLKSYTSIYIGTGYDFKGGENDNFSVELLYNKTGGRSKKNTTQNKIVENFSADYLSFAFLYQYEVLPKLKIGLGPQFNFLLNSKTSYNNPQITDDFSDNYAAVNGDLSYDIKKYLSFNLRYSYGFDPAGAGIIYRNMEVLNELKVNNLQIGFTYKFIKNNQE